MSSKKIIFIVGPTAVGKSDVAFFLAQSIRGEIVSCDSMQIYKEINIASNKPSDDMQKKIPHHLINVLSIEEEFDGAVEEVEGVAEKWHAEDFGWGRQGHGFSLLAGFYFWANCRRKESQMKKKITKMPTIPQPISG